MVASKRFLRRQVGSSSEFPPFEVQSNATFFPDLSEIKRLTDAGNARFGTDQSSLIRTPKGQSSATVLLEVR